MADFHGSLITKGKGAKGWPNTWTEVEYLGDGKFAASIGVGHRVFFDKADGGRPKKHKLTDERPGKDYVLIQGPKCCVEVYPYYAKYFDVQHEEVRLYEERWVVQRWRDPPGRWQDIGTWNPQITIEEYSEPAGDVVKVTVTYDTDYGPLTVEYFQRDGNALKHNVTFQNTSGPTETFRVVQAWAGIVGAKVNGKDFPVDVEEPFLAFRKADKKLAVAENLWSMVFTGETDPDTGEMIEKTDRCLQRPLHIESHAQGMKTDFIYGNWTLAQNESLEIDPDTATLDDPAEDGWINMAAPPTRNYTDASIQIGRKTSTSYRRGYVEWDISGIDDAATITDTVFKYNGAVNEEDCHIHEMLGCQPTAQTYDPTGADAINTEIIEGTVYADVAGFPEVGTGKQIDLGSTADSDLEDQLSANWFAIGLQADIEGVAFYVSEIYSEDKTDAANPKPTLYVEYTVPAGPVADGDLIGIPIIRRS